MLFLVESSWHNLRDIELKFNHLTFFIKFMGLALFVMFNKSMDFIRNLFIEKIFVFQAKDFKFGG